MSATAFPADATSAPACEAITAPPLPNEVTAAAANVAFLRCHDRCVLALIVLVQLAWVAAVSYGLLLLL